VRALLLRVGEDAYAVPIAAAREVVTAIVTPLPTAPSSVLGVCNVRGEIIPVFDSGVVLGLGALPYSDGIAVIETSHGPAGLAMTGFGEAVELGDPVAVTDTPGTAGAFAVNGGVAVLIDVDALLAPTGAA
jgi:chemotaxis signal transduction protein